MVKKQLLLGVAGIGTGINTVDLSEDDVLETISKWIDRIIRRRWCIKRINIIKQGNGPINARVVDPSKY